MGQSYKPRRFDHSPLFRIVHSHFEDLQADCQRLYSEHYGYYGGIITYTIERFLDYGDPRGDIARYECGKCGQQVAVPFSCKTRLFCPSCHEKKTLIWIEDIRNDIFLPVAHHFWTFSIPKRLRPYFMYDRTRIEDM